jgi:hypothetical protein
MSAPILNHDDNGIPFSRHTKDSFQVRKPCHCQQRNYKLRALLWTPMNVQNLHILNARILLDLSSVTAENDTQRKRADR